MYLTVPPHDPRPSRIVRVAVPKPLHQLFDYRLDGDGPDPVPGGRVRVPFGRQTLTGVCVELDPPDPHGEPRPLIAVLDAQSVLNDELLRLAYWLSDYYQHPLGDVFATLLPAEARRGSELRIRRKSVWQLAEPVPTPGRAPRQQALVDHLLAVGGRAGPEQLRDAGFSAAVVRGLAAKGMLVAVDEASAAAPTATGARLELNAEQRSALDALLAQRSTFAPTLLDGITGSGKTEVYLRLIAAVREAGRQVLVLVPEIALTPQTLSRFQQRFGSAATLHSGMTDAQRFQVWLQCRAGEAGILIGTRSAVLTPFRDLGLIVVDEEHDASFKQQDGLRYSARDVAVKRAHHLGIPVLLGSATPSFETLVNARLGRYRHLQLTARAGGAAIPSFHLLDIRGHVLTDGVSDRLNRIIRSHLAARGQVLVFLNRRGYAPSYLCSNCGWQASCRHCDMRLTLHRAPTALLCHHCGLREPLPRACPDCRSENLLAVGLGTQRAEAGLADAFPDVPLYRIDRDSTRSQRRFEAHLAAIHSGAPAILVGTQMLAKGHHFPNVTLVAVINADSGFSSADFRAPERTAQLIVQVAGRAGRAERRGEVWIQTYQPDNPMLQSLIQEGYTGFARRELGSREAAGLPPYRPMALIRAEDASAEAAQAFLQQLRDQLRAGADGDHVEVWGPVAAPIPRVANRFRFQLMVLAGNRRDLHHALRPLKSAKHALRWSLDIDPYDTF